MVRLTKAAKGSGIVARELTPVRIQVLVGISKKPFLEHKKERFYSSLFAEPCFYTAYDGIMYIWHM
jgi:hypothetical protein